jgi:peptidoglycan biosynthesis protein MviN/MurJ (putative lipid II flippase)
MAASAAGSIPEPFDGGSDLAAPEGAASDSLSVAVWTLVSRFTGVLRGITIAAVLGATYFANTFQFTNSLPNLVFYGLLAGSMFSSLLVPALVGHIDSGDRPAAARTAGGLLGMAVLGMLAMVPAAAVATPWLLRLGSAGAADGAAASSQVHVGAVLVLLLLPQVPLYAVVGTATAVMNAYRRFALPAAAPAIENLGTIAVLGVVAVLYAHVATEQSVPLALLLLLGLGTTGAVMLHASVQWWGARRVGIVLVPKAGWRDPQVRATIHRALPALAQAALAALLLGALSLIADRVPGGVVAFQLATNFYFLPIALAASPVALSLVPRLSRMTAPGEAAMFRDTYLRGLAFACFFAVPAATAYLVLSGPIAGGIGFGAFGAAGGRALIAAALGGLAPAIVGETLFLVTTYACYARKDTRKPLRGMIIQATVCAAGVAVVVNLLQGTALLTGLGLAFSAGSVAAAWYLVRQLRRELPRGGEHGLLVSIEQTALSSAVMILPAWAGAKFLASHLTGAPGRVAMILLVSLGGAAIYFAAQAVLGNQQVRWLTVAVRQRWRRLREELPGPAAWHWPSRLAAPAARAIHAAGPVIRRRQLDAFLLLGIMAVGALAGIKIKYAVFAVICAGLVGWVLTRPPVAAYLLIFVTPLVAGISGGSVVPVIRPNEALMVLLGLTIGLRWLAGLRTGGIRWPRVDRVEVTLVALGVTTSLVPLGMMLVRQRTITEVDLLYSIVLWKLLAEYIIVRSVISTREQAMRCLWLSMAAAAVVGFIAIVQAVGVAGVPALVAKLTSSSSGSDGMVTIARGSSLLGLPAATADLAILNLGIAVAMIARGYPRRLWLGGLVGIYVLTVIAASEFATVIGLVVALIALMVLTRSGRLAVYMMPVGLLGGVLLWPAIELRLSGFHSTAGLPLSWVDRLYNLRTFFWPVLFSHYNWILGVRPTPRVAAPSKAEGFIWIESGYTWLLWCGGIPLLASYIAFAGAVFTKSWAYIRRADTAGIVATAVTAAMCSQVVLMSFDPHLTFRGSGDAFFLLLPLIRKLPARRASHAAPRSPVAATAAPPLGVLV